MKKLALTLAIVLGLGMASFADNGGLFGRGEAAPEANNGSTPREGTLFAPKLPAHSAYGNQPAPVGSGIVVLTALGAAYLVGKKRKED